MCSSTVFLKHHYFQCSLIIVNLKSQILERREVSISSEDLRTLRPPSQDNQLIEMTDFPKNSRSKHILRAFKNLNHQTSTIDCFWWC